MLSTGENAPNTPYTPPNIFSPGFSQESSAVSGDYSQLPPMPEDEENVEPTEDIDRAPIPREIARPRGDKGNRAKMETDKDLSKLTVTEIATMSADEIREKYSQEQISAAIEKLQQEYKELFGVEYNPVAHGIEPAQSAPGDTAAAAGPTSNTPDVSGAAEPTGDTAPVASDPSMPDSAATAHVETTAASGPASATSEPAPSAATSAAAVPRSTTEAQPASHAAAPEPQPAATRATSATPLPTGAATRPSSAAETSPSTLETQPITTEQARATFERSQENPEAKGFFRTTARKVITGVLVVSLLGAAGGIFAAVNNSAHADISSGNGIARVGEQHEAQHGIKDGYNEKGMWGSSAKAGAYDFAAASEVSKVVGDKAVDKIIYAAENQVESMATYYTHIADQDRPNYLKGINTISEMENRLESLTDDEYDIARMQFENVFRSQTTTYEDVIVNGDFHNAYMAKKDASGATVHQNMQAVDCITHENGTAVTKITFHDKDGNVTGTFYIKDKSCIQPLDLVGGEYDHIYVGIPNVPNNPPVTPPVVPPEDPPHEDKINPKDANNLIRIDENIKEDIAENIGTDEVRITPTPGVSQDDLTPKPGLDAYQGTEPTIVTNQPSQTAEPVQETISDANDYSQNRGGANAGEYAPVQPDQAGQDAADAGRIPNESLPNAGSAEANDILSDLGIN